ncbi:MAG: threonine ammonia-lyase [Deferribacterota bacterium]|nr:threonine ammonia-lyase [Deferribacterota bacterium]
MYSPYFKEIVKAYNRINKYINNTPLYYSHKLSNLFSGNIYLKLENLQRTGSFKIRGALNCILKNYELCKRGIITASAGNHAQGVAFGAQLLNVKSTIVMPKFSPLTKINNTKEYGANIILYGNNYNEASVFAEELAKKENLFFIHPFNNIDVITGQGTIALEILEKLKNCVDSIIVPVGGGGLISGIGIYSKQVNNNIKIIGVQTERVPSMYESLKKDKIITVNNAKTIADGISVHKVEENTFNICKNIIDQFYLVKDSEIARSILFLIENSKLIVEGAAATTLALLLKNNIHTKNKNIVLIISGGNIDVNLIDRIINKGLVASHRLIRITVKLKDTPGSLYKIAKLIGDNGANILDLRHYRSDIDLDIDESKVTFDLETKGKKHIELLIENINNAGYEVFFSEL